MSLHAITCSSIILCCTSLNFLYNHDLQFNTSIYTPVCLPTASDHFYGMDSVATGWGVINSTVNDDPDAISAEVLQVSLA